MLRCQAGAVTLDGVTEAPLSVTTTGQPAQLGKVRASTLEARTHGGSLSGSLTGYTVDIQTSGGPMNLGALSGEELHANSRGGSVEIGALYGTVASINTGMYLEVAVVSFVP